MNNKSIETLTNYRNNWLYRNKSLAIFNRNMKICNKSDQLMEHIYQLNYTMLSNNSQK